MLTVGSPSGVLGDSSLMWHGILLIGMYEDEMDVFCDTCCECIGEYKMYFAQDHLREHPTHSSYTVKRDRGLSQTDVLHPNAQ